MRAASNEDQVMEFTIVSVPRLAATVALVSLLGCGESARVPVAAQPDASETGCSDREPCDVGSICYENKCAVISAEPDGGGGECRTVTVTLTRDGRRVTLEYRIE